MATLSDLRTSVDTTPLYAALGVTDLAVEKAREMSVKAQEMGVKAQHDFAPAAVQARATESMSAVVAQAMDLPAIALNQGLVAAGRITESYEGFAARGHKLVGRVRRQKATQDLVNQAETTVAAGKGAVTTARKAIVDIERSAKATVTTGRKEAVRAAEAIAASVVDEAENAREEVITSVKRTRTAARRTTTTTRKATARTRTSAKSAATGARKTATASRKAADKAADKVGK